MKLSPKTKGQPPRLNRRQLSQDLDFISSEINRRNRDLAETTKTLTLLRLIDAITIQPNLSLVSVCQQIAEVVGEVTDQAFTGVLSLARPSDDQLTLLGYASPKIELGLHRPLRLNLDNPWLMEDSQARLIDLAEVTPQAIAGLLNCSKAEVGLIYKQLPLKAIYAVKLSVRGRLIGTLVAGFTKAAASVHPEDTLALDSLSETLAVALDNKLLMEANRHLLHQLKGSNAKLLALDEAKDDFISMASHQLRTPLTSIKGILSMAIEGDMGKLTPQQNTMLTQAFGSCQRMVYIIADLLNVSRLKTGKFVINSSPLNLSQVVHEEVEQLMAIAKTHGTKLVYSQPKNFPMLNLDETKTRQVIMNFIDNALYYTPKGGKIEVSLINKDHSVELRVKDNGLGVPKSEQPHLFTKFFRAANARKARPDGTGLGLYMAKKIIIAQSGAIIFESTEGQGSTFGFSLNKTKLTAANSNTQASK